MNIELQRHQRDESVFARQVAQLNNGDVWKRRYEESQRFLHAQLERETENCKEISALRAALIDANARAKKWQQRCCEIQNTTL